MTTGLPGELVGSLSTAGFQNATNGDQSVNRDFGTDNLPAVVLVMNTKS
jgi:hypothetical protein